jgi:hypothetical protein
MANVYVEARPKGRPEGTHIDDYVVEDHADHVLGTFSAQHEAIQWAEKEGHHPFVPRVRHLNDKKKPDHWRSAGGPISAIRIIRDSIERIGAANPANVQQIAASQLELLVGYHQIALAQSRRSFFWALVGSGIGLIFFVAAVAFALVTGIALAALIPLLSGAIVEIVAGIVFVLYGKTTEQLSSFHSRLEVLQRYLLANSLCEALDGDERNKARAALIQEISRPQVVQTS